MEEKYGKEEERKGMLGEKDGGICGGWKEVKRDDMNKKCSLRKGGRKE